MRLRANILKHRGESSDGPMGMFSSKLDEVTVVSADEALEIAKEGLLADLGIRPVVIVVERMIFGKPYLTAYPCDKNGLPETDRMFGGCFVYSSDSRFHVFGDYPIPLHDRKES